MVISKSLLYFLDGCPQGGLFKSIEKKVDKLTSREATLDITRDTCPITFVRAKLTLEKMHPGDILRIRLSEGEPLVNVPFSLADHGHEVISRECVDDGIFELVVRRGSD